MSSLGVANKTPSACQAYARVFQCETEASLIDLVIPCPRTQRISKRILTQVLKDVYKDVYCSIFLFLADFFLLFLENNSNLQKSCKNENSPQNAHVASTPNLLLLTFCFVLSSFTLSVALSPLNKNCLHLSPLIRNPSVCVS